jgi:hypothetical protein
VNVIWKYPLTDWGPGSRVRHAIDMPSGATVLALQDQFGMSTLWVQVDPEAPRAERTFEWVGTGHPVPEHGEYVGTVQVHGGQFVFHLYEVTAPRGAA